MVPTLTWGLQTFDGCRKRCLPVLYKALDVKVDDDRMKGALYTLNCPAFGGFILLHYRRY